MRGNMLHPLNKPGDMRHCAVRQSSKHEHSMSESVEIPTLVALIPVFGTKCDSLACQSKLFVLIKPLGCCFCCSKLWTYYRAHWTAT